MSEEGALGSIHPCVYVQFLNMQAANRALADSHILAACPPLSWRPAPLKLAACLLKVGGLCPQSWRPVSQ